MTSSMGNSTRLGDVRKRGVKLPPILSCSGISDRTTCTRSTRPPGPCDFCYLQNRHLRMAGMRLHVQASHGIRRESAASAYLLPEHN